MQDSLTPNRFVQGIRYNVPPKIDKRSQQLLAATVITETLVQQLLQGRQSTVKFKKKSIFINVRAGVPQGAVIPPSHPPEWPYLPLDSDGQR